MASVEQAVVVVPAEVGKRLIARAVAQLPQVQRAKEEGLIVIGYGTTNAYVAEELLGHPIAKERYCAGYVGKSLSVLPPDKRDPVLILERGKPVSLSLEEAAKQLSAGDVFIKGANALDSHGVCGVLVAGEDGGTVGKFFAACIAKGVEIVIPISRAKSIHGSVTELAKKLGIRRLRLASGLKVGLFPLVGTVVTEVEAIHWLYGVHAEHVGSGGVGPGAGAVVLLLCGEKEKVERAFSELSELARSEPPLMISP